MPTARALGALLPGVRPDGRALGALDLTRFRTINKQGREKRVFIDYLPLPVDAEAGWYSARVRLHDGSERIARDYVLARVMAQAADLQPADGAQDVAVPGELRWAAIDGARYYQVFVRDLWNDGGDGVRVQARARAAGGAAARRVAEDGLYSWRVHARDIHEDPRLGDFDHGSITPEARFSVAP